MLKTKQASIYDLGVKINVSEVRSTIKGYDNMTPYERAKELDALSVERTLKRVYQGCRSKAIRDDKEFEITPKHLMDAWKRQDGKCYYSGIDMQLNSGTRQNPNVFRVSVDRTINTQGYLPRNIKLVCWSVNQGKGSGHINDYVTVSKGVAKNFK
jgi:hypothetical protein